MGNYGRDLAQFAGSQRLAVLSQCHRLLTMMSARVASLSQVIDAG
jgi:hypothetical protein